MKKNETTKETGNTKKKVSIGRKIWRTIKTIILLTLIVLTIGGVIAYRKFMPIYKDTKQHIYEVITTMDTGSFRRLGNTYIYDKNGQEIGKLGNEKYDYVESSDISQYIKNAYIAQEDKNFATHPGIDIKAITRAAIAYIKHKGHITQGGSTITQQVIKNNLLSNQRTFSRKFTEIFMALELEKTYTKAQLMEFYCNSNYYGCGCYGVEGAAQYYFGRSAKDVSLAEAAMIAGISNRPSEFNPVASYEKATKKKESVLKSMLKVGAITQEEFDKAMAENPEIVEKSDDAEADSYMISYAVHCATLQFMKDAGFNFQYKFDTNDNYEEYRKLYKEKYSEASGKIRSGGYKIYTSFDPEIQSKLQETVKNGLNKKLQGAAVCIDNKSQMVIAMVGGKTPDDDYNRAFLMERSPGSSIKPLLVYGPALNEGIVTTKTYIKDEETDINGYNPKNADGVYLGDMTIREALARSRNTIAVKLLYSTGIKDAFKYLQKMKFSSICYADTTILSTALGGFTYGIKPVDMAKGYATIANQGVYKDNDCLIKIVKEDDSIIYQSKDNPVEVYNADTAYILKDMMQGVFREEYGTAHDINTEGHIYAAKTGTTNNNKDAWFCGFSDDYTTVVWCGCDKPKSVKELKGSSYPAEIWINFMNSINDAGMKDFQIPDTVYLENESGNYREVQLTDDLWASRPKDYDYMSHLTEDAIAEKEKERRIKKEKEKAEESVSAFEKFQISNTKEAMELDERYNSVLGVIREIEDENEQIDYEQRAAYKYGLLSGDVEKTWEKVMEQEKRDEQKKNNLKSKSEAAESKENALSELREKKKKVVNWYIDELYDRELYTDVTQEIIKDALAALEEYKGYDGYDSLKSKLDDAIDHAEKLPTREEVIEELEKTKMPADNQYPKEPKSNVIENNSNAQIIVGN